MLKFLARGTALAAMIATSSLAHAETLKMWGPEQITEPLVAQLWNGIKADFERANPDVTVEFMPPTGTISNGAVQAAIQSDAGPDVILTNSGIGRISVVKNAKQVMPLTEQYEKRGWKDQIYPWLYTELKGQFGGEIYEVPDGLDALGIWYHKDIFAQAGWKIPATWAEFETLMKAIEETGLQPIAIGPRTPGSAGHLFGNLLQSASGKEVIGKALRREVAFDDPSIAAGASGCRSWSRRATSRRKWPAWISMAPPASGSTSARRCSLPVPGSPPMPARPAMTSPTPVMRRCLPTSRVQRSRPAASAGAGSCRSIPSSRSLR